MKLSRLWRRKKPSPYGLFPWSGTWDPFLYVNRIPILQIPEERIAIQRIPPVVHETSHAFRLFSESKMTRFFSTIGKVGLDWDDPLSEKRLEDKPVHFKGYLIENS
jgi:hypothetical protein